MYTVPIKNSERRGQLIHQTEICDKYNWQKNNSIHFKQIIVKHHTIKNING